MNFNPFRPMTAALADRRAALFARGYFLHYAGNGPREMARRQKQLRRTPSPRRQEMLASLRSNENKRMASPSA